MIGNDYFTEDPGNFETTDEENYGIIWEEESPIVTGKGSYITCVENSAGDKTW